MSYFSLIFSLDSPKALIEEVTSAENVISEEDVSRLGSSQDTLKIVDQLTWFRMQVDAVFQTQRKLYARHFNKLVRQYPMCRPRVCVYVDKQPPATRKYEKSITNCRLRKQVWKKDVIYRVSSVQSLALTAGIKEIHIAESPDRVTVARTHQEAKMATDISQRN